MSDVQTLLARCQKLGATFTPGPDGKLKVRAPAPLPEELREQLRRCKSEVLALLSPQQPRKKDVLTPWGWLSRLSEEDKRRWEERNSWPCRHCGKPAEDVTAVFPGAEDMTAAMNWLKERLTMPQHIALIIAAWVGTFDRTDWQGRRHPDASPVGAEG
jgi:hypothetical protein